MDTMLEPKAFLFDLNGTLVDDMAYHADAWFDILNNELKASLTANQVKEQMYGKNSELLVRIFGENHFTQSEIALLEMKKERSYQQAFLPHLACIAGAEQFLKKAQQHQIRMAIGSAAIPFNIDFVLDGLNIRQYFGAIVSASDVEVSKPDPETFLQGAALLGVAPKDCVVFEDAPKGVEAAARAGMPCVVLTTMHAAIDFASYSNILFFIEDYKDAQLNNLLV
jgi:beta-phosphoglucomutase